MTVFNDLERNDEQSTEVAKGEEQDSLNGELNVPLFWLDNGNQVASALSFSNLRLRQQPFRIASNLND